MRQYREGESASVELDVLGIAAHRDDLEIGAGGTLARLVDLGYRVGALDLTAGEAGTSGDAESRAREAEAAAQVLGLAWRGCLDLPDAALDGRDRTAVRKVVEVLRRSRPTLLVAPDGVARHPDHREASHLVTDAVFFAGMRKFEAEGDPHRPDDVYFFMERYPFEPSVIVDITTVFERKRRAILAYATQFHNPGRPRAPHEETFISDPAFLESLWTRCRWFGDRIRAEYGEPFLLCHPPEVADPVALARGRTFY
jgi:bacillithiol biosynthesis deacetylase BshB1